jgi:hypothetical protein
VPTNILLVPLCIANEDIPLPGSNCDKVDDCFQKGDESFANEGMFKNNNKIK